MLFLSVPIHFVIFLSIPKTEQIYNGITDHKYQTSTDKLTLFNLGELHLLDPGDLVSYRDAPGAESVCCLDLDSSGCSVSSFRRGKSGRESSPPLCPSAIANLLV